MRVSSSTFFFLLPRDGIRELVKATAGVGIVLTWKENEDGSGVFLNTSQGNEDMCEKYKKNIGKDVIGSNWFNYTHLKPYDGGMEFTMATCFDPNGSIPTMLKNQAAGRLLRNGEKMVHLMLTGEVLK